MGVQAAPLDVGMGLVEYYVLLFLDAQMGSLLFVLANSSDFVGPKGGLAMQTPPKVGIFRVFPGVLGRFQVVLGWVINLQI